MDIKKFLIGTIIGGLLFFLLGWLIYGNLLMNYFHHNSGKIGHVDRPTPEMLYLIVGNLLQGATFAYIFTRLKISSLGDGLVTGGIIGFLMGAGVDFIMYSTTFVLSKKAIMADVIAFAIMCAIVGAVLGLISGNKKTD